MTIKKTLLFFVLNAFIIGSCTAKRNEFQRVKFKTTKGTIVVKLYPETSKHSENFLKLVESGMYDSVLFHRVIADFMIQAGDPDSKNANPDKLLGSGDVGYSIPAEFVYPKYYHKKGALAAAREGDNVNPQKASSGCQFYIVKGKVFTDAELDAMEKSKELKLESKYFKELLDANSEKIAKMREEKNQDKLNAFRDSAMTIVRKKIKENPIHKFSTQQRADYKTIGGAPHLDGSYTVFGEVVEGLDIVVNISNVKTGKADRPLEDIRILKAKKIK